MVAEPTYITRAQIGAVRLLSIIFLIILQQEIGFKNVCFITFYLDTVPFCQKVPADDKLIEDIPLPLIFVGAEVRFFDAVEKEIV